MGRKQEKDLTIGFVDHVEETGNRSPTADSVKFIIFFHYRILRSYVFSSSSKVNVKCKIHFFIIYIIIVQCNYCHCQHCCYRHNSHQQPPVSSYSMTVIIRRHCYWLKSSTMTFVIKEFKIIYSVIGCWSQVKTICFVDHVKETGNRSLTADCVKFSN